MINHTQWSIYTQMIDFEGIKILTVIMVLLLIIYYYLKKAIMNILLDIMMYIKWQLYHYN